MSNRINNILILFMQTLFVFILFFSSEISSVPTSSYQFLGKVKESLFLKNIKTTLPLVLNWHKKNVADIWQRFISVHFSIIILFSAKKVWTSWCKINVIFWWETCHIKLTVKICTVQFAWNTKSSITSQLIQ